MTRKSATDIDRLIFDLLFQKEKPVPYGKLYNWVKDGRKKPPSHQTFSRCLSRLQVNSFLGKTSRGYLLRDKAYFLHRLKILEFNRPSQTFLDPLASQEVEIKKRLKIYLLLSHYGKSRCFYPFQTREQFEDFLSSHHMCENDLTVLREYDIDERVPRWHIKEFFLDQFYDIKIRIVEKKLEGTIGKISYDYSVPGFSIIDILKQVESNCLEFYYLDPTRSDLQKEVDMLSNEGLLERILEFDNEIRYRFSDHVVLGKLWDYYDDSFNVMGGIWKYLRSPKKEEKEWLEFFYGSQSSGPVDDWLRDLRHNRSSNRLKNRKVIDNIRKSMPEIHGNFENLTDSLTDMKYRFFVEKLLEYIYPAFMRRSFNSAIVV